MLIYIADTQFGNTVSLFEINICCNIQNKLFPFSLNTVQLTCVYPRNSQELCAFHRLHCTAVDDHWGVCWLFFPEIHSNLFSFVDVEKQIVLLTPVDELLHLLSVCWVIVVFDEAHHCCVICKFDDVIRFKYGTAVVGHQREKHGGQHTSLRHPSVDDDGHWGVVSNSDCLRSVC